ncbi:MAG: T9SS type A sorting domain-containing protein [Bacteroidia bacterium]
MAIGFGAPGLIGMPDTIPIGDTTLVAVYLKNYANIAFNDSIEIAGTIDTGAGPNAFSFTVTPNIYIAAQDSLFSIFPVRFDVGPQGNFRIGNNVIIVWPSPVGSGFGSLDTITAVVFIPPLGLLEYQHLDRIKIYPNPSENWFTLDLLPTEPQPVSIVIHDVYGRCVFVADNPGLKVDATAWPTGVYFIEYFFEDKSRHVSRIIKR